MKNKSRKEDTAAPKTAYPAPRSPGVWRRGLYPGQPCAEAAEYMELRASVPIIDAALSKLVRLLGVFEITCPDKAAEKELRAFLTSVRSGPVTRGIDGFVAQYFSTLLTVGTAVGEIVTDGREILALYTADPRDVEVTSGDNPLEPRVSVRDGRGGFKEIRNREMLIITALNPDPGSAAGNSILKGLPFIADILMKVYEAVGANWERCGRQRYAVTYKPPGDEGDRRMAAQRAKILAEQWAKTMQSSDPVHDFVAVGDVQVKVIGGETAIPDSQSAVRQLLEQITAKTGIPPFLLGFSWSTTERMSDRQADILTSEIEYYRRLLEPAIMKIARLFLSLKGRDSQAKIVWSDITLQDELQQAQASYYRSRSRDQG